ncbi:phosphoglucosamine mutase [Elusimicrobium simillimum]|uniref:phosphoglucosamine mutase n=1 Tax=Elusimicrobium simillimum TaxID=3143438 RepID=UPI003C6FBE57
MKYFGTDGVRAVAGQFPLVEDFVVKLGYAAVKHVDASLPANLKKSVVVCEDSRASGAMLLSNLSQGIMAAGYNVISIGVAPTPAVSFLVKKMGFAFGAVVSASHNPAEFNGIKFFNHEGKKMNEADEQSIENILDSLTEAPIDNKNAEFEFNEALMLDYQNFLVNTVPQDLFKNVKIVLDCANGATSRIAPMVFEALGADVVVMANTPDGKNINAGVGALHTEGMQALVKERGAFCGFSFDGDGDRVIAADEMGRQLDGDHIIAASALELKRKNKLNKNKVVLTIMANLSVINFLKEKGMDVELTGVGDKYVSEALEIEGLTVGGETSGHIIFNEISPTGDGILAALQLSAFALENKTNLSAFHDLWHKYPALLTAVKVENKVPLEEVDGFEQLIKELEDSFKGKGRIIVRYSGTEPKLRILVEGEDDGLVKDISCRLEEHFRAKVK